MYKGPDLKGIRHRSPICFKITIMAAIVTSSLARDLQAFYDKGYRIKKICTADLFPSTYHIETVCLLSKQ